MRLLRSQALCSELKVLNALLDGNHIDVQEVSRARDIQEMITLLEAMRTGKYANENEFEYEDKMIAGTNL